MPFIDERGRVLGRFNVVDAALVAVLVILVPAAYGSYLLFRDPTPTLTLVQPGTIPQSPDWQVEIRGEHFRPYLRVTFNETQAKTFLLVNPTTAVVGLPDLAPGTYDVALFDYAREVARLPKALIVQPAIQARVELDGVFEWLNPTVIEKVRAGVTFNDTTPPIEFVSVEQPRPLTIPVTVGSEAPLSLSAANGQPELPVRARTTCAVQPAPDGTSRCAINGVVLKPGVTVRFPGTTLPLNLRVSAVRSLERLP